MLTQSTLGFLLIWIYLLTTLHCVLLVNCLDPPLSFQYSQNQQPPPPIALQPQRSQVCWRVSASVWDLAPQKLRVTSTPSHFETDPWRQLLGDPSDVSISLSKEIARGSTRSPWANQTLHKAQMDALSPACRSWGGGHPATMLSPPIGLNKLPMLGPIPSFSFNLQSVCLKGWNKIIKWGFGCLALAPILAVCTAAAVKLISDL